MSLLSRVDGAGRVRVTETTAVREAGELGTAVTTLKRHVCVRG